jgi:methylase of polypeptide subunit release factors
LVSFISDKSLDTSKPTTLVANLPYIPDETFDENSPDNVQKREPRMAFV